MNRVSRSFAIVIQQLPVELRDAVCAARGWSPTGHRRPGC